MLLVGAFSANNIYPTSAVHARTGTTPPRLLGTLFQRASAPPLASLGRSKNERLLTKSVLEIEPAARSRSIE